MRYEKVILVHRWIIIILFPLSNSGYFGCTGNRSDGGEREREGRKKQQKGIRQMEKNVINKT